MFKLVMTSLVASLALGVQAHAGVTFTSTAFDPGVPAGQVLVEDFDHPIAAGYSFVTGQGDAIMSGSVAGFSAAPAGDTSTYAVVSQGATAAFFSNSSFRSASVYLGSLDSYNKITFLDHGMVVAAFTGGQLVANPDGDQQSGATNRLFDFNFGRQAVDEIEFSSSGNSFEFDNIAVTPAPEPQTWVLLIAGIGLTGLTLRRFKRDAERASSRDSNPGWAYARLPSARRAAPDGWARRDDI